MGGLVGIHLINTSPDMVKSEVPLWGEISKLCSHHEARRLKVDDVHEE